MRFKSFVISSFLWALFVQIVFAQDIENDCSPRFKEKVFDKVDFSGTYVYSRKPNIAGILKNLHYDFYEPVGDTAALRPLIIMWHGGAFLDVFNKRMPDMILMAHEFVKRGYTVISADYRGVKDPLDLLSEKEVVKEVVRSVIDGNDLVCKIMDDIENHGNPHRINKDEIFAAGVSGGAILGMHLMYIKSLEQMPSKYRDWAMEVDDGYGEIALQNKFCYPNPIKGFISISGAILDTSWMQPNNSMSLLIFHGAEDDLVPYGYAQPLFGTSTLPYVYGGKYINEQADRVGIPHTFIDYPDRGHVPYMNISGSNFGEILQEFSKGLINEDLFNKAMDYITDFITSQIECEKVATSTPVRNYTYQSLNLFPNPTEDAFQIQLNSSGEWQMDIMDITGKRMASKTFFGQNHTENVASYPSGMYLVRILPMENQITEAYSGKLIIK